MFWELRNPAGNYMFKVGLKYGHWRCSDIFIANFEHISHLVLMFLLLTFEQENAGWVTDTLKRNLYVYIISKIPRKIRKKRIFSQSADLKFKHLPFGVYHGADPRSQWAKQTIKKLNLWGETAIGKSACIKTCSRRKGTQATKFGQLTEYNMRNIVLDKSSTKCVGESIPRLFS